MVFKVQCNRNPSLYISFSPSLSRPSLSRIRYRASEVSHHFRSFLVVRFHFLLSFLEHNDSNLGRILCRKRYWNGQEKKWVEDEKVEKGWPQNGLSTPIRFYGFNKDSNWLDFSYWLSWIGFILPSLLRKGKNLSQKSVLTHSKGLTWKGLGLERFHFLLQLDALRTPTGKKKQTRLQHPLQLSKGNRPSRWL